MYIQRKLTQVLQRATKTFPAVILTGARQTGKTTLLRTEFGQTHEYVSLERPDVRNRAAEDPAGFLDEVGTPVILDEIQRAPELLHHVKDRIDEDRRPGRWMLTGSQEFTLMKSVSQTLSGRAAVLQLDPFSTSEISGRMRPDTVDDLLKRVFGGRSTSRAGGVPLGNWLLRGGFPEPRANPEVDRQLWFSSYVQTYLERDVRDLTQVADLGVFSRFVMMVGVRTGNLLNLAELAREAGVTLPTAKRWLSVLETSQVVYLLPPYYKNFGKRIRKSPKVYVLDPGLATFLLGLHSEESITHSPTIGALMETAVAGEWWKAFRERGERPSMFFWRESNGTEVDLVIERGGKLYGIEVKSTATPAPRHVDGLRRWMDLVGESARGVLACHVDSPMALRPGVRAVPWCLG